MPLLEYGGGGAPLFFQLHILGLWLMDGKARLGEALHPCEGPNGVLIFFFFKLGFRK